jgi:hypothetical protein
MSLGHKPQSFSELYQHAQRLTQQREAARRAEENRTAGERAKTEREARMKRYREEDERIERERKEEFDRAQQERSKAAEAQLKSTMRIRFLATPGSSEAEFERVWPELLRQHQIAYTVAASSPHAEMVDYFRSRSTDAMRPK